MDNQDLRKIQDRIGYEFKNFDLLEQAFVRKSYAREKGGEHNEILEFIGDKVLDMIAVKFLTDKYGYYCHECSDFDSKNDFDEFCCERTEGQLTELKKLLVKKDTLADVIGRLQLNQYLIMGKGDSKNNVGNESSVKEDLFEAIIGAVALDSDWNWDEISSTVEYMLEPEKRISKNEEKNYVELIQEWSLKRYNELPDIHSDNSNYYDETSLLHYANEIRSVPKRDPNVHIINVQEYPKTHFVSKLRLRGIDKLFVGYGSSKNAARKDACELAYHYLDSNNLLFSIQDEIENPSRDRAINQLETLARRGYFSIPTYKFEQEYDNNGNPVWKCECYIEKVKYYYFSTSSSKKEAKKSAAFDMLLYVLGYEKED